MLQSAVAVGAEESQGLQPSEPGIESAWLNRQRAWLESRANILGLVGFCLAVGIGLANQLAFGFAGDLDLLGSGLTLAVAALVAGAGIAVALTRRISGWHLAIAATAFGTTIAPVVSAMVHSERVLPQAIALSLAVSGAVLCAGAAKPATIRSIAFWTLAAIIWVSLALAVANLLFGGEAAFRNHYYPRYSEYLGLPVLSGITGHQNTLGFIAAIALPVQWVIAGGKSVIRRRLRAEPRTLLLVALGPVATAIALLWSQSRTSLAAAVLGLIVVSLPLRRLAGRTWAFAWAGLLAVLALGPLAVGFAGITTFTGRVEMWTYAFADFRANPLFGYGSAFMGRDGYWRDKPTFPDLFGAHNQLMEMLGRTGMFGAISFIAMAFVLAVAAWKVHQRDGGVAAAIIVVYALIGSLETLIPLAQAQAVGLREVFTPMILALGLIASSLALVSRRGDGKDNQDASVSRNARDAVPHERRRLPGQPS